MEATAIEPGSVVGFWREAGPERWFAKDEAFDDAIRARFEAVRAAALTGELDDWEETPEGALALILLLDQFSRNLHRGTARAFEADGKALGIAERALAAGHDAAVEPALKVFFYLPFMHAEQLREQALCVRLCYPLRNDETLHYAREHEHIIRRFGRFPHRNSALGRYTSPAEQAYLDGGGFAG
ncbi:DUF924 family protein [Faunimonas sp. B44]|uniref:DUF924 family protein n=1 Tax=Faunimonas sp. B44 TaxID=3461493 RepID=UPI0040450A67